MLIQEPVIDLTTSFMEEIERVGIVRASETEYLVVEDEEVVLKLCSTLRDAKLEMAAQLITRLDDLRKRVVTPLFRMH
jgi:hypothetical protein